MTIPPELGQPDDQLDRLHATARHHVTGPDGARIHWASWGPRDPDAPVLVMLHGAYGSWPHFVRTIEAFSRDHCVLIPDLPGYGRSDLPDPLAIVAIGRAIASGLDHLVGDRDYRLFGFSFGGAVAGRLMVEHRDRISHALLAAPAGIASSVQPAMAGVRAKQGDELVDALRFNLASIMFSDPATIGPQALRIQHECSRVARLRVERVDWGPGLGVAIPGFPGHLSVVWGEDDAFVHPAERPDRPGIVRGWNPDAGTHVIKGAGHWVQYEAADQVNAILRDLLAR